ncbi:CBS domain-containing protein [Enterococcus avium]
MTGVVNQKDFYYHVLKGEKRIEDIVKPISFIPKSMKISELMKKFQAEQIHIAIIIDEYGGTAGLVTLEDIIEELVGKSGMNTIISSWIITSRQMAASW